MKTQQLRQIIREQIDRIRNWKQFLNEDITNRYLSDENDFYLLKANENQLKMLKDVAFNNRFDKFREKKLNVIGKYTDESNWITSKNFDALKTDGLKMSDVINYRWSNYPIFRKKEIRNHPTDYIYLTWNKKYNSLEMTSSSAGPDNFSDFEGLFNNNESHHGIYSWDLPK